MKNSDFGDGKNVNFKVAALKTKLSLLSWRETAKYLINREKRCFTLFSMANFERD
jgi:hypothetical protein